MASRSDEPVDMRMMVPARSASISCPDWNPIWISLYQASAILSALLSEIPLTLAITFLVLYAIDWIVVNPASFNLLMSEC